MPPLPVSVAVVGNGIVWLRERERGRGEGGESEPYLIDCILLTLGNSLSAKEVGNN